jgi:FixJ family two-component response regulator
LYQRTGLHDLARSEKSDLGAGVLVACKRPVVVYEAFILTVIIKAFGQRDIDDYSEVKLPGLVHVVDDDVSFQTAIVRRLKLAGYDVATYLSAQELLDHLPDNQNPGCILLDVQIPGLSGPELQSRLIEIGSTLPVVFLTGHADTATTVRAIKAGAEDFLTKPVPSGQLIDAIERAMARQEAARSHRNKLDSLRALVAALTPRERQVFHLVVRGRINKQVAFELGTTERTVKAHRHQVMEKMQVRSLAELVSIAERLGLLDMKDEPRA